MISTNETSVARSTVCDTVPGDSLTDAKTRLSRDTPSTTITENDNSPTESLEPGVEFQSFNVSIPKRPQVEEETDDHLATWTNDGTISWGCRVAKDGSWTERWVTQEMPPSKAEASPTRFGECLGLSETERKVWAENWVESNESMGTNKLVAIYNDSVTKEELQSNPGGIDPTQQLQSWQETRLEEKDTGIVTIQKCGTDYSKTPVKQWREELKYGAEDENSIRPLTLKRVEEGNVEQGFRQMKIECPDPNVTISSISFRKVKDSCDDTLDEEWIDEWEDNKLTNCSKGSKRGLNSQGERWREEWQKDHSKNVWESKKELISADQTVTKTEVSGRLIDEANEEQDYRFVTETSIAFEQEEIEGVNVTNHYKTTDKSWSKKDGNDTWGEKSIVVEKYMATRPDVLVESVETTEHWFDNGGEQTSNKVVIRNRYKKNTIARKVTESITDGANKGDGSTWRHYSEIVDDAPQDGSDKLVRSSVYKDDSWKEASGNAWGKKHFLNVLAQEEFHEDWYNNGKGEEQSDVWYIHDDGSRDGYKHGKKVEDGDVTEWRENWRQTSISTEACYLNKSWVKYRNGEHHEWGESEGHEGSRKWVEKWTKAKEERLWKEHTEKWHDDGFGNVKTEKVGSEWRDGTRTNWYSDTYGECLGKDEKWAFKQGESTDGKWVEKWNETPSHKSAMKEGVNRMGDEWNEEWVEDYKTDTGEVLKIAVKTGKNAEGERWREEWKEEGKTKIAKKTGFRPSTQEQWEESWGEEELSDGSGTKWTSKWAKNASSSWGNSWGDRWGKDGQGGHRWGEEWQDDNVKKWAYDISSRRDAC